MTRKYFFYFCQGCQVKNMRHPKMPFCRPISSHFFYKKMPENTPQTTMGATIEVYLTSRKKISLDTFGQLAKLTRFGNPPLLIQFLYNKDHFCSKKLIFFFIPYLYNKISFLVSLLKYPVWKDWFTYVTLVKIWVWCAF